VETVRKLSPQERERKMFALFEYYLNGIGKRR
jgi:hypothetical protein